MRSQFAGTNDLGTAYLREVSVVAQLDGGWGVFVAFNANDVLVASWTKEVIEVAMIDAYGALYTSGLDVRLASVAAYFPVVDEYGTESDTIVYKTILGVAEAQSVNWDNALIIDWSWIWKVSILHPEFR